MDANHIADLIRQGQKIEAIKALREATGVGLKEAKEEIERLERGLSPSTHPLPSDAGAELPEEVRLLMASGKKIEAIRVLREQTGMGLKEAKEAVERVSGKSGCTVQAAALIGFAGLVLYMALGLA
ncbi:MAG: ribosomal protein L7/L12 [Rhodothermales bacterium]